MAPYKRGKEFKILVEKDAKDKAVALSKRYDLPMKEVLTRLIDFCVDYDLITPGWEKRLPILVEQDAKDKAISLSQRYKLPMKVVVSTLIDLCVDHDLLKPGWEERLNAAMDKGDIKIQKQRYQDVNDPCAGLFYADEFWKCLWAQEGKTPHIKKLAKDLSEALDACASCDKTGKMLKHNLELKNQVTALEVKLEEKSNQRFMAPVCKGGAHLDHSKEDQLIFRGCPKRSGSDPVSVEGFCKVYSNGLPCALFGETLIGVGKGKTKENPLTKV